jgi:hypothetical protein
MRQSPSYTYLRPPSETLESGSLRRVTFGRTPTFRLLLIHYELYIEQESSLDHNTEAGIALKHL